MLPLPPLVACISHRSHTHIVVKFCHTLACACPVIGSSFLPLWWYANHFVSPGSPRFIVPNNYRTRVCGLASHTVVLPHIGVRMSGDVQWQGLVFFPFGGTLTTSFTSFRQAHRASWRCL